MTEKDVLGEDQWQCGIEGCTTVSPSWALLADHIDLGHPGYLPPKPLPGNAADLDKYAEMVDQYVQEQQAKDAPLPTAEDWRRMMQDAGKLQVLDDTFPQRFIVAGPTAHEAWNRCMDAVKAVAKRDRNEDQHFSFRGVDAVVNAMGPVMREHGVHVIPHKVKIVSRTEYETSRNRTRMVNSVVKVQWRIYGPHGDWFPGESIGEAADSGDKGWSKAQSVAWRVFLIQAGALPTDDQDPDSVSHERATAATTEGSSYEHPEDAMPEHVREAIARADQARYELLQATKGFGWDENKLVRRYWQDYNKNLRNTQDVDAINGFRDILVAEAKAQDGDDTKGQPEQGD